MSSAIVVDSLRQSSSALFMLRSSLAFVVLPAVVPPCDVSDRNRGGRFHGKSRRGGRGQRGNEDPSSLASMVKPQQSDYSTVFMPWGMCCVLRVLLRRPAAARSLL